MKKHPIVKVKVERCKKSIETSRALTILAIFMFLSCGHQSGRKQPPLTHSKIESNYDISRQPTAEKPSNRSPTVIKMKKKNGVYEVPIEINGVPMNFIFDTGAGIVSISETEVLFLYKQGLLSRNDIIGSGDFIDATGQVSKGIIINLRAVRIGNRTLHDIKASVVSNLSAPLLLGQSVLQKFGKVNIDYNKMEITLD